MLFEATSLSEGRGTDEPFQLIGAPWIRAEDLVAQMNELDLAGVHFEAASFSPRSIAEAAPSPRFEGELLYGVRIVVTDPSAVAGLEVGVHLLAAIIDHGASVGISAATIIDRPQVFDRLAGTTALRTALVAGDDVADLLAGFESEHGAFRNLIASVLLYE